MCENSGSNGAQNKDNSTEKPKQAPIKPSNAKLTSIKENFGLKIEKKDDN